MQVAGHLHQFSINVSNAFDIGINNLNGDSGIFLQAIEDLQTTAATIAAHSISGIGDALKLIQNEAWNNQCAEDKASLADIGDATIDDRAGIEQNLNSGLCSSRLILVPVAIFVAAPIMLLIAVTSSAGHRALEEMGQVILTQHSYSYTQITEEQGTHEG